ncbi:MAG TPA: prevent-host-death protein [Planctomycetota bacterium]|nr:prevent-host-death protein [Planctomycetota bacterium]HRT94203.1 prevent-host-death protein [Planctomycetota bacterium]
MKFMSIRDFRSRPIRKDIASEREIVLTANGQPVALVSAVAGDELEDELMALRRARARIALDRIRARAKDLGLDKLTMEEIDAEIAASRRERRARR